MTVKELIGILNDYPYPDEEVVICADGKSYTIVDVNRIYVGNSLDVYGIDPNDIDIEDRYGANTRVAIIEGC